MKFAEEFAKYSPNAQQPDPEDEDPEADYGMNKITKNSDAVYDRKLEYLQANPIGLEETAAGRESLKK